MSLITESKHLIKHLVTWMHFPGSLLNFAIPCGFILIAPECVVRFFLAPQKVPKVLNPWLGLFFLYLITALPIGQLSKWYKSGPRFRSLTLRSLGRLRRR